ncbi:MAG: plasmid mobilization protein [Christensenellales bacterium]
MPDNRNWNRPIQVKFFVDERELGLIKARMAQLGIENMSAYLRKMAINGYEEKPDLLQNAVNRTILDSLFKME